jgi:hypothetical protein
MGEGRKYGGRQVGNMNICGGICFGFVVDGLFVYSRIPSLIGHFVDNDLLNFQFRLSGKKCIYAALPVTYT